MTESMTNLDQEKRHQEELAALRKQVRDVARKYAAVHGWCDTVELALKEAGVIDPDVQYTVNYAGTTTFTAPPGLTTDEVQARVKLVNDHEIVDFTVGPLSVFGDGRYLVRYISTTGRVQHLIRPHLAPQLGRNSVRAICGKNRTGWSPHTTSSLPAQRCIDCGNNAARAAHED